MKCWYCVDNTHIIISCEWPSADVDLLFISSSDCLITISFSSIKYVGMCYVSCTLLYSNDWWLLILSSAPCTCILMVIYIWFDLVAKANVDQQENLKKHWFWNKLSPFCWSEFSAHFSSISFLLQRLSNRTLEPCRSVTASVLSMCGSVVIKSTVVLYQHISVYKTIIVIFFFWCCLLVVYPPIVLSGQSLFSHNMHADCCTPWINIYSEPRSVVINRKAAGEILLSLSLESPVTLPVSGQLVQLRRCLVHTCLHSMCDACSWVCVYLHGYVWVWKCWQEPHSKQVSQQML